MDNQVLINLKKGDKGTIQKLYETLFPALSKYVLKNSGQMEDAEDIFQEALVVVFRKIKEEGFTLTCALSTYIFAIGRNIWLDRLRRKSRHPTMSIENDYMDEASDAIEVIHKSEKMYLFQNHFLELKEECRRILTLFFEGNGMKYITDIMGYQSVEQTRKRKFQCKEYLVRAIKSDPIYQELGESNILLRSAIN